MKQSYAYLVVTNDMLQKELVRLLQQAATLADALTGLVNVCTHPQSTKADMARIAKEARFTLSAYKESK